ncbi:MAG: 1-acyl-sn-glycerol-3-phosphate acyltransferase [Clostridia bacterium]|nr:1-acyl-sn-glycerol-3-phosphate acyltransferase [Clostridia bacterium]
MKTNKHYHYYYFDEVNDDFANNGIVGHPTPNDYVYLPKNFFFKLFKPIVYYFILFIVKVAFFFMPIKFKNKKVLKTRKEKKKGCFIYANHTGWFIDACSGPYGTSLRQCYTIVHPDAISIKGTKTLMKFVGALPVPSTPKSYINFVKAIDELYEKGKAIVVYPEAHIWPKYNKIREFPATSFNYPAKLNAPSYVKTTVYKQKKNGKVKPVIFFDGPFYPNMDLPLKERQKDLRDTIFCVMNDRVKKENSVLDCRYEYTKVNNKEEVRSEIFKNNKKIVK